MPSLQQSGALHHSQKKTPEQQIIGNTNNPSVNLNQSQHQNQYQWNGYRGNGNSHGSSSASCNNYQQRQYAHGYYRDTSGTVGTNGSNSKMKSNNNGSYTAGAGASSVATGSSPVPPPPKEPCLINLDRKQESAFFRYPLLPGVTMLGTGRGCLKPPDVVLHGSGVAPQHCFIERNPIEDEVILHPISELTAVDDVPISGPTPLVPGSVINIGGSHTFRFDGPGTSPNPNRTLNNTQNGSRVTEPMKVTGTAAATSSSIEEHQDTGILQQLQLVKQERRRQQQLQLEQQKVQELRSYNYIYYDTESPYAVSNTGAGNPLRSAGDVNKNSFHTMRIMDPPLTLRSHPDDNCRGAIPSLDDSHPQRSQSSSSTNTTSTTTTQAPHILSRRLPQDNTNPPPNSNSSSSSSSNNVHNNNNNPVSTYRDGLESDNFVSKVARFEHLAYGHGHGHGYGHGPGQQLLQLEDRQFQHQLNQLHHQKHQQYQNQNQHPNQPFQNSFHTPPVPPPPSQSSRPHDLLFAGEKESMSYTKPNPHSTQITYPHQHPNQPSESIHYNYYDHQGEHPSQSQNPNQRQPPPPPLPVHTNGLNGKTSISFPSLGNGHGLGSLISGSSPPPNGKIDAGRIPNPNSNPNSQSCPHPQTQSQNQSYYQHHNHYIHSEPNPHPNRHSSSTEKDSGSCNNNTSANNNNTNSHSNNYSHGSVSGNSRDHFTSTSSFHPSPSPYSSVSSSGAGGVGAPATARLLPYDSSTSDFDQDQDENSNSSLVNHHYSSSSPDSFASSTRASIGYSNYSSNGNSKAVSPLRNEEVIDCQTVLEIKRKQAHEARIAAQRTERSEKLRLEEILAMCAEYEEQIAREIREKTPPNSSHIPPGQLGFTNQVRQPHNPSSSSTMSSLSSPPAHPENNGESSSELKAPGTPTLYGYSRIKTNGSLPREKNSTSTPTNESSTSCRTHSIPMSSTTDDEIASIFTFSPTIGIPNDVFLPSNSTTPKTGNSITTDTPTFTAQTLASTNTNTNISTSKFIVLQQHMQTMQIDEGDSGTGSPGTGTGTGTGPSLNAQANALPKIGFRNVKSPYENVVVGNSSTSINSNEAAITENVSLENQQQLHNQKPLESQSPRTRIRTTLVQGAGAASGASPTEVSSPPPIATSFNGNNNTNYFRRPIITTVVDSLKLNKPSSPADTNNTNPSPSYTYDENIVSSNTITNSQTKVNTRTNGHVPTPAKSNSFSLSSEPLVPEVGRFERSLRSASPPKSKQLSVSFANSVTEFDDDDSSCTSDLKLKPKSVSVGLKGDSGSCSGSVSDSGNNHHNGSSSGGRLLKVQNPEPISPVVKNIIATQVQVHVEDYSASKTKGGCGFESPSFSGTSETSSNTSRITENFTPSPYQLSLSESRTSLLKKDISDVEQQEMEALREMEIEKALLLGEEKSLESQLASNAEEVKSLNEKLEKFDEGIRLWRAISLEHISDLKGKLVGSEKELETLEKIHETFEGTTDEETTLLQRLKLQHELVESDKKAFEDAEFHHMEEQVNKETYRDELAKTLADIGRKVLAEKHELEQLQSQNRVSFGSSSKEIQNLEKKRQELIKELQRLRESNKLEGNTLQIPESAETLSDNEDIKNADLEEKLKHLSLYKSCSEDALHIERIKSRSPIDPKMGGTMGAKTCETLREIERNREYRLNEQGVQMLEQERQRVRELQKRVQDAVREEWEASRKSRNNQCQSLNSVGSDDSTQTISDTPTDSGSSGSDDTTDKSAAPSLSTTDMSLLNMSGGDGGGMSPNSFELCDRDQMRQKQREMSQPFEESRPLSDGSAYDNNSSIVNMRDRQRLQNRPLTRYLPVRGDEEQFDLRAHIESSGHQLELCPHVVITATSARGFLSKLGSRFHNWNKRWFVFDRETRTLSYYIDKSEKKPRGGIHFQAIEEVYVDHLQSGKSPTPKLTFCVKTYNRVFHLVAPSAEAMRIWVDIIFTGAEGYQEFKCGS